MWGIARLDDLYINGDDGIYRYVAPITGSFGGVVV